MQHFEGYDASTIHLINHVEGHGFVEPGGGLEFCKSGEMDVGGSLPVNMAGGILSGSYMHGWNHVAEIVRQLRHEAGPRQVKDVQTSMFSLAQTDQVHPVIIHAGEPIMTQTRPNRTLGPGHDDFWAGCAEGELRIQHCTACDKHSWPVVADCEHCGSTDLNWQSDVGQRQGRQLVQLCAGLLPRA